MANLGKLLEPANIGALELSNRLVMAPMGTFSNQCTGVPLQATIDHYVERAKGGVGLIIVEATMPMRMIHSPHHLRLYDDAHVPHFRKLTDAVHSHGAKIALQLAGMGVLLSSWLDEYDDPLERAQIRVLGPSAIPWARTGYTPEEATREDIATLVEGISDAARRAKDAGFDAVDFHGAHGLMMSSFLSPRTNRRTDEYGGSIENRCRFVCEVIQRTREKVGAGFPIILRISGSDFLPHGMGAEQVQRQVPLFVEAGVDALSISASFWESSQWQFIPYMLPDSAIVHLAEAIKKVSPVPIIAVGKIPDPQMADQILRDGKADFVAMGRPLLADPHMLTKAREGKFHDIAKCIYCNNCLAVVMATLRSGPKEKLKGRIITCTVNPALLRDREFELRPAASPKRIMVVGGGLAGMEAATVLAERGHAVVLYEKDNALGGQWNIACRQEHKHGFASVAQRLGERLATSGAKVVLGTEVTREVVVAQLPDAVVIASGAVPSVPHVPGIDGANVVQAVDVIAGKAKVGNRVIVVGGRAIGMEVADALAEQGKHVSLVTRARLGGKEPIERSIYFALRDRLIAHNVHIYQFAVLQEVTPTGAYVLANNDDLLFLAADHVVLAVGSQSELRLRDEVAGLVSELYTIGDAASPRSAVYATNEGAEVGRLI